MQALCLHFISDQRQDYFSLSDYSNLYHSRYSSCDLLKDAECANGFERDDIPIIAHAFRSWQSSIPKFSRIEFNIAFVSRQVYQVRKYKSYFFVGQSPGLQLPESSPPTLEKLLKRNAINFSNQ